IRYRGRVTCEPPAAALEARHAFVRPCFTPPRSGTGMSIAVQDPLARQGGLAPAEAPTTPGSAARPLSPAGSPSLPTGRHRRTEPATNRVRRDGKFFRLGADKFYVKGVTYGPFAPNSDGHPLPDPAQVRKDFEQIRDLGGNCVRVYHVPPAWFLDLAIECGLKVFLD